MMPPRRQLDTPRCSTNVSSGVRRAAATAKRPVARNCGAQSYRVVLVVEHEHNIGATDPTCGESRISDPVDLHERTASLGSHLPSVTRKADEEDASVDLWGAPAANEGRTPRRAAASDRRRVHRVAPRMPLPSRSENRAAETQPALGGEVRYPRRDVLWANAGGALLVFN